MSVEGDEAGRDLARRLVGVDGHNVGSYNVYIGNKKLPGAAVEIGHGAAKVRPASEGATYPPDWC